MNLIEILKDSLALLRKEPKAFLPKLVTTFLYSVYFLWGARLTVTLYRLTDEPNTAGLSGMMVQVLLFFLFIVAILLADLLSYAMYPSIVAAHREGKQVKLLQSLKDAIRAWKVIITFGAIIFAVMTAISLPATMLALSPYGTGNPLLTAAAGILAIIAVIALSIAVFFVVPIAVVEHSGVIPTFLQSLKLGMKHTPELLQINLILLVLVTTSLIITMLSEFQGITAGLAIAAFIITRLVQALIYSYICVINPYVYLHVKEN